MMILYNLPIKCAVCGNISMQETTLSMTISFTGLEDLDTRPLPLSGINSHLAASIQICPICGYCAPNISVRIKNAKKIMCSKTYQEQLHNSEFPYLANAFLCYSMILESGGNYANAGWASLRAAWVCDDAGNNEKVCLCRKKAAHLFEMAKKNNQIFAVEPGMEEALMVDLLRRSGKFELALEFCNKGLRKKPDEIILDILKFQKKLIKKRDVGRHAIMEVTKSR